jgi:hypothetical protein
MNLPRNSLDTLRVPVRVLGSIAGSTAGATEGVAERDMIEKLVESW